MSAADYVLGQAPQNPRQRELWLQHLSGFILWEDVRAYALNCIDPALGEETKAAAAKAVDDAIYGLMMVADGVTGGLRNADRAAFLKVSVHYETPAGNEAFDLSGGDGMCMGYHGWINGDFGETALVEQRSK